MRKFILISKRIAGWIEYYFTKSGVFTGYQIKAVMQTEDILKVAEFLPSCLEGLRRLAIKTGAVLISDDPEITFEQWYELFPVHANRTRAIKLWNKLNEKDRIQCFIGLESYKRYCKRNPWYSASYPDSWIFKRQFETEWDKVTRTDNGQT